MSEQSNHAISALNIEGSVALQRYMRGISSQLSDGKTLHLYEHRNKAFSVHGHENIAIATSFLPTGAHIPVDLPATQNNPPVSTLILDAATARNVTAGALFTAGRKAVVWTVSADGRITSSMEGTPGCPASLTGWLGERADDGVVLAARPMTRNGVAVVGLAAWDPTHVSFCVTDLFDNHALSTLESVFVATNARELVIPDDIPDFDRAKLDDLAERCSLAITIRKRRTFDATDVLDSVARLSGAQLRNDALLDGKAAASAAAALLEYCGLLSDPSLEGRVRVAELTVASCMQLDTCVMRALNILPFPGDGGKRASLYGLLNRCRSAMGSRLLRRWLSQPLQDADEINARLDVVDAFVSFVDARRTVRDDHLAKLSDIQALCRRFTRDSGKRASMQDVVKLYQCSVRLPLLCAELESVGGSDEGILTERFAKPLRKLSSELSNFEALVEMTIDLEKISIGEFVVSPSVDPELGRLKDQQDEVMADLTTEYEKVKYDVGETLKLERKENLGYIFRLTRKEERLIRGKKQYMVMETRKDGVRFQTMELRKQSRRYESIAAEYTEVEKDMRTKTLEVAGTYVEVFIDTATLLAELDVLCTFAVVSEESRSRYVRPSIGDTGSGLVLKQARHPIVEENLNDDTEYIANDIDLQRESEGDGEAGGGSLVLVTGPNMGGKSTFIRSAGVLTLMAHVGMFVPCTEAQVPITDRIFARVGAADNQHRAVSTFMSEMLETASILRGATSQSLVIIDELGRGTGTTDGFGLAYAISKHIATQIKCACLFATHFYELTALSDDVKSVRNTHVTAAVSADGRGLTFLYEVQPGACDQSFGVHVAEMAHFPACVTEAARKKASEMEGDHEDAQVKERLALVSDEDRQEGLKLITAFEKSIDQLPTDSESDLDEAMIKARALKDELLRTNNSYVTALFGAA